MSEKEVYFKAQFNHWDSYSEEKKNFINFFMKDACIFAGLVDPSAVIPIDPVNLDPKNIAKPVINSNKTAMRSEDPFYTYEIGRKQDIDSYNRWGIHFDSGEWTHGIIQSASSIISVISRKPDNRIDTLFDLTILPKIDGKVNTDTEATPIIPAGLDYIIKNIQHTGVCNWKYRTSSFGIRRNNDDTSKIESVHYKIGVLDIIGRSDDDSIIDSEMFVRVYGNNRTLIELNEHSFSDTDNYFPYREISNPLIEFAEYTYTKMSYFYIELCKDGGGYFDNYCEKDDDIDLWVMDQEEWLIGSEGIGLVIVQNSNDDYIPGSVAYQK